MTTILDFPQNVFTTGLVPQLTAEETRSFSLVSKAANKIIQAAAEAPQEDIKLSGEKVSISLDSIAALLRQKLKMKFLTNRPDLLQGLIDERKIVCAAGGDPNDIPTLIKHACRTGQVWLHLLVVPFDYNTKQIPALDIRGIGDALVKAMLYYSPGSGMVQLVLAHPNMPNVPTQDTNYGLDSALGAAVYADNPKFIQTIRSLPNAAKIQVKKDYYGLEPCLLKAVERNKPNCALCIRELLGFPNAVNIPVGSIKNAINHEVTETFRMFMFSKKV